MKKIIHCDKHYGGAYSKNDKHAKRPVEFGTNVIYDGDIWDFSGAKKNKIPELADDYRTFLQQCRDTGTITVRGNHESIYGKQQPYQHIENGVLYIHGHRALWDREKWERWENKKGGKSWWKYMAIVIKNTFAARAGHGVNKKTLIKLAKFAEARNCDTIVCGHKHSSYDGKVDGIRVIICNRGRTEIDV